jgi:predicted NBD/HSP70 family sugar kinase
LESPAERLVGKRNLRRSQILDAFRTNSPMSRIETARFLGLNLRTVSLMVDELVGQGLLNEHEEVRTTSGRRPTPVSLNIRAASVLGLDIGRKTATGVIMDLAGNILARHETPSSFSEDSAEQVHWLDKFTASVLAAHPGEFPPLAGAGLTAEGMIHRQHRSESYRQTAEPLRVHLEQTLGLSVFIEGDSRLAAIGEYWFGAETGVKNLAVINLSEGLGFSAFIDGRLCVGHRNWAGEVGHMPLGEPDIPCFCGSKGCLENTVSAAGLLRLAAGRSLSINSVEELAQLAKSGSPPALEIFSVFSKRLALAVSIIIELFNPEAVVIGGRLSHYADLFMDSVMRELKSLTVPYMLNATRITSSRLSENAITMGTCAIVLDQIFGTSHALVETLL